VKARRVIRGRLQDNEQRRIVVDDGNFNDGWRIVRFTAAGDAINSNEVAAKVSLKPVPVTGWNWALNTEIAWASARNTVEANWGGFPNAIDPSAVIVADLYVTGTSSAGSNINFMIEIERVALSDDQAILALIQERAQDDL
tara:strand:+ start:12 stop:434 length:423 start_codon:yes stop_codon:yes gene_type:complete